MKAFPSEWVENIPNTTGSSHVSNAQTIKHSEGGMDLRDYFAVHCPFEIADLDLYFGVDVDSLSPTQLITVLTNYRYRYADYMMKAREQ